MAPWILVIDDDPFTREALASILERAGYRVTSLGGAGGWLETGVFPQSYRVAVVDYHLPAATGLEVARRVKQVQPDCAVVLISSELPPPAASDPLDPPDPPMDRFLAKPFSKDAILEVIAQLCLPSET